MSTQVNAELEPPGQGQVTAETGITVTPRKGGAYLETHSSSCGKHTVPAVASHPMGVIIRVKGQVKKVC